MFLVIINNKEFINNDEDLLFLGEWSKIDLNESILNNYETVPFQFANMATKLNEQDYILEIEEKILEKITPILNVYLNLNKNKEYYRIILGYWLILHIHKSYFQYKTIKYTKENYSNLNTYILDRSQYVIPLGSLGYGNLMDDNLYNLQGFSDAIRYFNIPYKDKKINYPIKQQKIYKIRKNSDINYLNELNRYKDSPKVTIVNPYFSLYHEDTKRIAYGSDKIIFDDFQNSFYELNLEIEPDYDFRNKSILFDNDDFLNFLGQTLLSNIPLIFLEGHNKFSNWIINQKIKKTPIYYTANGLYINDFFKFFLAINRKNLTILSHQHGAGYGTMYINFLEEYEKKISDKFYTFGWQDSSKTSYLPFQKIQNIEKQFISNNRIILLLMDTFKFEYRISCSQNSSQFLIDTIDYINNFLKLVDKKDFFIRFYMKDLGWNSKEKILINNKNILEDNNTFEETLYSSKLIIMEHLGTSFLQRIAINKPIIVFVNPKTVKLRTSAEKYFLKLKKVGIFHHGYESAAKHFNNIENDIEKWWKSNEVQKVIKEFNFQYARTTYNWTKIFINELENQVHTIEKNEINN